MYAMEVFTIHHVSYGNHLKKKCERNLVFWNSLN